MDTAAPPRRSPARWQISVILTDECNMRCSYCTTAKRPAWIPAERVDRIVALVDATGDTPVDLNFHGGEPTLAWERVEQLALAMAPQKARRRVSFNLCTNATALDADRARFLAAHGFDVRVSIDGHADSHTRFRHDRAERAPGARAEALHAATLQGLRALVAAGATTAANMVVTPATVGHLLANAVFLVRQGLVHLVVSPVVGMAWGDADLLELDAQLQGLPALWRRWMAQAPTRRHEDLRRSLLSEIDRATYCIGERMNQPDARVLVFGPDGRIFGDEPEIRTEKALVLGHLDDCTDLAALPPLPRTAFQLMYDRAFYAPEVLRDVRRTHRLLRRHMRQLYAGLFGALPPEGLGPPPGAT